MTEVLGSLTGFVGRVMVNLGVSDGKSTIWGW